MADPDRLGQGKARIIDAAKQLARGLGMDIAPLRLTWGEDPADGQLFHLSIAHGERAAPSAAVIRRSDLDASAFSATVPQRIAEEITAKLKSLSAS